MKLTKFAVAALILGSLSARADEPAELVAFDRVQNAVALCRSSAEKTMKDNFQNTKTYSGETGKCMVGVSMAVNRAILRVNDELIQLRGRQDYLTEQSLAASRGLSDDADLLRTNQYGIIERVATTRSLAESVTHLIENSRELNRIKAGSAK